MGDPGVRTDIVETLTSAPERFTVGEMDAQVPMTRFPLADSRDTGGAAALARGADLVCGRVTYLPSQPEAGYHWDGNDVVADAWVRPP